MFYLSTQGIVKYKFRNIEETFHSNKQQKLSVVEGEKLDFPLYSEVYPYKYKGQKGDRK